MYNIQKAVSRLDYAPNLKEIQITDIRKGIGHFTPKPDKPVSLAVLKDALKKAGYTLDAADITVVGTLTRDQDAWLLVAQRSQQRFSLKGSSVERVLAGAAPDARVEIIGEWSTTGDGSAGREVISPRTMKHAVRTSRSTVNDVPMTFMPASFNASQPRLSLEPFADSAIRIPLTLPLAPIRTTTPGLTVYKGGAIAPRVYFINQHLGSLNISRQRMQLSVSYTPSPRLQLEAEVPFSHTSFDNGETSGSSFGLANITLWSKYRFFRTVKTFGDRQAAVRFGLELPTGKNTPPSATKLNAPAFVRQQLTPINGGLSPHFDLAYSQAQKRVVFGANAEGIVRSERAGFRLGHELRVNTDLEYVLLPLKYESPGHELFVILETTFVHRGLGRVDGRGVPGSTSTEYYLAPGLQYAAASRWVIEGSYQMPVVRNTGPLVLRSGSNLLIGVKYLY